MGVLTGDGDVGVVRGGHSELFLRAANDLMILAS